MADVEQRTPAWKPADQIDPTRICEGPGCRREFRPSRPGQRFCSERCEAAAAVVASARGEPAAAPAPDGQPAAPSSQSVSKAPEPSTPAAEAPRASSAANGDVFRCANCGKKFTPGKGGWSVRYCKLACAQEAAAKRTEPPRASSKPAQPRVAAVPPAAAEPEPETVSPPAPAAVSDPVAEIREYGEGHTDGFRSGVREATELTFTLMRSPTFRGLDSVVALMIIREVLDS